MKLSYSNNNIIAYPMHDAISITVLIIVETFEGENFPISALA